MKVVELKCPNCGSFLERGQMKCRYCGAELVLLSDGSSFRFRSEMACPKCGSVNEKSSWFCVNCNALLTSDIDMLKELQRKIKFEQERVKKFMPDWMKLESDEFLYYVLGLPKILFKSEDFYAVTDKRVIKNRKNRKRKYEEAQWSEVVGIDEPQVKTEFLSPVPTFFFEVRTFHGTIKFDMAVENVHSLQMLHAWAVAALDNHIHRKKDVRALILKLPLGE